MKRVWGAPHRVGPAIVAPHLIVNLVTCSVSHVTFARSQTPNETCKSKAFLRLQRSYEVLNFNKSARKDTKEAL